jgi:cyclopropane fatty-acyl-phospholipid synthase-like methyltransferase
VPGGHERESAGHASAVRAYYESNTRLFLALGIGRRTLAIRRAVWADGVDDLAAAVNYVNGLVAAEARRAATKDGALRILDIGCGVGGSLLFLAGAVNTPLQGIGVTISPRQAVIARRQARIRGLSSRCSFIAADFARLTGLPRFPLSFAIESFVHFTAPAEFFAAAARSLAPGGRLMVIDDFLAGDRHSSRERGLVSAFRQGWLLPSLCTVERAVQCGAECGLRLVEDRDLSSFLSRKPASSRMGKPASSRMGWWAVRVMRALPVPWPYWRSTMGSLALEACRRARLVEYHVLVFEKQRA